MKELLHLFDPEMGNSVANIRIQLRYIKKLIEAIISDEDHDIDDIKAVIPEAASEENKLTDKNYVDTELEGKIDVPEEEPTDGQILSSQNGTPTWINPTAGSVVDTEMSDSSTNPVQNNTIKEYVDDVKAEVDEELEGYAKINGSYDTMSVGSAKNLEAPVDVTGSFLERPTGGTADVANGLAQIQEVQGDSVKFNQLVDGITELTADGITTSYDSTTHIFSITNNSRTTNYTNGSTRGKLCDTIVGHKYAIIARPINGANLVGCNLVVTYYNIVSLVNGGIVEAVSSNNKSIALRVSSEYDFVNDHPIDDVTQFYLNITDLTAIFGSGNEPTTVAEFEAWLTANVGLQEYYDYNAGSIINNNMTSLESTSSNLLDPATGKAELVGVYSQTYPAYYGISGTSYGAITFKDRLGNTSTITPDADGKFLIETAGTLTVATPSADTTVFMWFDGSMTDYEDYSVNAANLDVTHIYGKLNGEGSLVQVWPTGMPKVNDVVDKLCIENGAVVAKRNLGEVDLGDLTYTKNAQTDTNFSNYRSSINGVKYNTRNILCGKYTSLATVPSPWESIASYNIFIGATTLVVIDSASYTNGAAFATANNGVLFYYELATSKVYTDLVYQGSSIFPDGTPVTLPVNYIANNYGVERVLPKNTSTILTAKPTIVSRYSVDAVETLNTHSDEIADLYNVATPTRNGLMSADDKKTLDILKNTAENTPYETSYIIDQTEISEGVYRLPEEIIIKDTPSMNATKKVYIDGKPEYLDVIARIRDHSHIYVGQYNSVSEKLECKQVSDGDKGEYLDGTPVVLGTEQDLFMKLPKFWWKCEEISTDIYKVRFSTTENYIDNTWNLWNGDTFIGVYKAIINENKVYSKSGVTPTVNQSWTTFTADARARYSNNNYRLITNEAHNIMALLGYGWLGTTDSQSIVGKGISTYPKTTGLCNSKGMTDSSASVDGNSTSINFWGLENWWGDISEWVDNLKTADTHGTINVLDDSLSSTPVRTIAAPNVDESSFSNRCSVKLILGSNGDIVPKKIIDDSNYNRGYCDYGRVVAASGFVASRSGSAAILNGGLACLNVGSGASGVGAGVGSRLLYKGDYIVVDTFSE